MPITFKNNSLDKLIEKLTFTDDEIKNLTKDILEALGKKLQGLIEEKSPKDTGKYAKDWKVNDVQDNKITVSNPDGKKFTLFEFTGRRPSKIEAKKGGVLHFTIGGKDIFVTFMNHPGFSVQPHVIPSLETLGREGKQIIVDIIKQKFPMFK